MTGRPSAGDGERYVLGYLDRFSYAPGSVVSCMVSATEPRIAADVIRLARGIADDAFESRYGPRIAAIPETIVSTGPQTCARGSYVIARDVIRERVQGVTLTVRLWPTRPRRGEHQGLLAFLNADDEGVFSVGLDHDGVPVVHGPGGRIVVRASRSLHERRWYEVRVSLDAERVELHVRAIAPLVAEVQVDRTVGGTCELREARHVLLAAAGLQGVRPLAPYDGKLEHPRIEFSEGAYAAWAFERAVGGSHVEDVSGRGAHGLAVNTPTRAMTGSLWNGSVTNPRAAPGHYNAIHFHADDLDDARWSRTLAIPLPADLASGAYAIRLRALDGSLIDHVPFVVTPRAADRHTVAVLLPTFTYQAYANLQPSTSARHPLDPQDSVQQRHPEFGKSLYDGHDDGSGVCTATLARPMLQIRPGYRSWLTGAPRHFSADLFLLEWLEKQGVAFDVICDHDVDDRPDSLAGYAVVLTGSHPEYCTGRLLDALDRHVAAGGNLMYLGGNGFYWVTARFPANPNIIEVRRHAGTRTWDGEPGEQHLAATGEPGGLWRDRGRPPNRLTGVGMTAQGWEGAAGYRRTAQGWNPQWAWIFEGVERQVIGDYGFCLGGASGDELDRFDVRRGSPPDAVVLATSLPHGSGYHAVVEEVLAVEGDLSAASSPHVRSDMVLVQHAGGGRTFSVGSISFIGSLLWNGGDNDVSRIVANVLREFQRVPRSGGA